MFAELAQKAAEREKRLEEQGETAQQQHDSALKPATAPPSAPPPPTFDLAAAVTSAARDRERRAERGESIKQDVKPTAPSPAAGAPAGAGAFDLAAMVSSAAKDREKRIEQGDVIKQDVKPTAPPVAPAAPPGAFDIAALVSSAARDREKRLNEGGEKKMTTIVKEKEEYKEQFNSIAVEAAELGRLTRLHENVVEAVAVDKDVQQEDAWRSKGLMAIEWRTNHMSVIHEAAKLGNETKMPEHVATNYEEEEDDYWYEGDYAIPYKRMAALEKAESKVEQHVILQRMLDDDDTTRGIIKPMYTYNDITRVVLPKGRLPKYDQTKGKEELAKMSNPLSQIGNDVIKLANERRARLDQENAEPVFRTVCKCGYCDTASPHQTFAYRVVEGRVKGAHIPKELQRELASTEGKKYKVAGKGGKTRITRALKTDSKTGEIDKDQHFYTKEKERQKKLEEARRLKNMPRQKQGRVARTRSNRSRGSTSSGEEGAAVSVRNVARAVTVATMPNTASPIGMNVGVNGSKDADRAKLEAEIRAMEEAIAKQKRQAEERAKLEAEIRAMEEAIEKERQQAVERAKLEAEIRAMEEAVAKHQAAERAKRKAGEGAVIVEERAPMAAKQNVSITTQKQHPTALQESATVSADSRSVSSEELSNGKEPCHNARRKRRFKLFGRKSIEI